MPNSGLEVGSAVLRAWIAGREDRLRREEFQKAQENEVAKREQQQQQFDAQQALHKETLKQGLDIHKREAAARKAEFDATQLNHEAQMQMTAAQIASNLHRERMQYGGGPTTEIGTAETGPMQVPIDERPFPNSTVPYLRDMVLPGKSQPMIPYEQQDRNLAGQARRTAAEQVRMQEDRYNADRKVDMERIAASERNADKRLQSSQAHDLKMFERQTERQAKQDAKVVSSVIGEINKDKTVGRFAVAMDAYNSVKPQYYSPINPGISDTTLLYMYLRTLDDSVVRESEIKTVRANANSKLANFGISLKQIVDTPHYLSPSARQAIIKQMEQNVRAKAELSEAILKSSHARVSAFTDEDYDTFKQKAIAGAFATRFAEEGWSKGANSNVKGGVTFRE